MALEQFPSEIRFLLTRNMTMQRQKSQGRSLYLQRRQNANRPYYQFQIQADLLSESERETLTNFWEVHHFNDSNQDAFLFDAPKDDKQTGVDIGDGDGSTKKFQILFKRTEGSLSMSHPLGHIDPNTETVYLDGSETTAYSLDDATGVITFDTAPADGVNITVDYEFLRKVIFLNNQIAQQIMNPVTASADFVLVEVN